MLLLRDLDDPKTKKEFLELLTDKLGDYVQVLYSQFGDDIFLMLSIFESKTVRFPAFRTLNSLRDQCLVHKKIKENLDKGFSMERAVNETAYMLQLSDQKTKTLYKRHEEFLSSTDPTYIKY